jgi:glutamate-1-semialdehyde 2,1-aminomutase
MGRDMKTIAIVQARMNSSRLPNKVMKEICGSPMIQILLNRLAKASEVNQIVVATGSDHLNESLIRFVNSIGFLCEQGSDSDVLSRYVKVALQYEAEIIVRITGDCPLVDPNLVDELIQIFKARKVDYLCNNYPPTLPDGLDIEIFSLTALLRVNQQAADLFDREHVTPYFRKSSEFIIDTIKHPMDLSELRWTVDEAADLEVIRNIFEQFYPRIDFGWQEVFKLYQDRPNLFNINNYITRNEGASMGTGQKLWKRAKHVIPGGNMLLSKRAEMFLPKQWPAYFSKTKGCKVFDLDGKEYLDLSLMGVGTNILGYSHPEVDKAVFKAISNGNMSTLNCPEEVYLAEKLVELHPWSDMARFARTGGEANSVAIRIARAASGKDNVAICGYHGWHDWYLAANLGESDSLDGHLLPGLEPKGVPRNLKDTIFPFEYNNFSQLEEIVRLNNIGVIKMEVVRNFEPQDNFLHKVRKLATDNGIVLVFDECTSGFRETFGGIHKKYGVDPDIAIFGKALGNGYSITGIIGRRSVMEAAQSTFISSTFWTERIGPSAALATLSVMEQTKSWDLITKLGLEIRDGWKKLAATYGLNISYFGLPALGGFSFQGSHTLAYKTLITQEMLNKGYLASNSIYTCTEHTPEILKKYFDDLDPIFSLIKECEDGRDIASLLNGPICHSGFKRLN